MDDFLKNHFNPVYKLLICCKGIDVFEFDYQRDNNVFKIIISKDYEIKDRYMIHLKDNNGNTNGYHADLKEISKYKFSELLNIISENDNKHFK